MKYKNLYKTRAADFAPGESSEQKALFTWARMMEKQHPVLRLLVHCPNGGARDAVTGARLKAEGVKAGFPDILLLVARGEYHGLAIELKRRQGGALTQNQRVWLNRLTAQGYRAVMCKGASAAIKEIEAYLSLGDHFRIDVPAVESVLGGICGL